METRATEIASVDRQDGTQLVDTFSDGISAVFFVDELLELRPNRRQDEPEDSQALD